MALSLPYTFGDSSQSNTDEVSTKNLVIMDGYHLMMTHDFLCSQSTHLFFYTSTTAYRRLHKKCLLHRRESLLEGAGWAPLRIHLGGYLAALRAVTFRWNRTSRKFEESLRETPPPQCQITAPNQSSWQQLGTLSETLTSYMRRHGISKSLKFTLEWSIPVSSATSQHGGEKHEICSNGWGGIDSGQEDQLEVVSHQPDRTKPEIISQPAGSNQIRCEKSMPSQSLAV